MRRKDFFQFKQFGIQQGHAAQKVGTDSDLLGALALGGERILDIGTGTGVLALMMAQRFPTATVTAVEIDDNAILDASENFRLSPWAERITLVHSDFQDFAREMVEGRTFDSIICNPPYFDRSLEAPDESRTRARHTSSLPFAALIGGAYQLLEEGGYFSVCIPPEVLHDFESQCIIRGFWLQENYRIQSVPEKGPKRYIQVYRKGPAEQHDYTYCMRNADRTYSDWYREIVYDFCL